MNTTIQIFENQEFGAIRTMSDEHGEPLFCGRDVASALEYKKPFDAIVQHVEEDDTMKRGIIDSLGREQLTTFINESGLYDLIKHLFVHEQLGLSECYIDREKGYIHVAHDASGFNVWPFLST